MEKFKPNDSNVDANSLKLTEEERAALEDMDMPEEDSRRAKKAREHERFVAEILSKPQKVIIEKRQLVELRASGEVILKGINLYGRELKPGEKVILVDEYERETEAEFVEISKVNQGYGSKFEVINIKVRLPKRNS